MIEPNIYCKVSGMAMECIARLNNEGTRKPIVIEIGCADGQGTMRFAGFCSSVICIDPMIAGRPDVDSRKQEYLQADQGKINEFKRRTLDLPVELVQMCSMWPETVKCVQDLLGNQRADVLIIDGCHHPFESVWGDFELYYPLVRKGGYIIFDDLYEECILKAYEKSVKEHGMEFVDRFALPAPNLQDTCALRKTED